MGIPPKAQLVDGTPSIDPAARVAHVDLGIPQRGVEALGEHLLAALA